MRNSFKGLDVIDSMPDELWTGVRDIVQETGIKTIPMEKKRKNAKWLSEEQSAWSTMDRGSWHSTGDRDKTIPVEKKCKKAKWLSEEALLIAMKRREVKSKGEKERYSHLNAEFQRIARRHKKAFLSDQCKEIEENNRVGKTRDLFKKSNTFLLSQEIVSHSYPSSVR